MKAALVWLAGVAGVLVAVLAPRAAGLGALLCAVVGVFILAGFGWALLAAVPFLLLMDWTARR